MWPVAMPRPHLSDFLRFQMTPLSERAATGFFARTKTSSLRFRPEFLRDVERHVDLMRRSAVA
jgi:DNA (cytosine-5)-methyltransferase 1